MITKTHDILHQKSVAVFSDCEEYRYLLSRTWNEDLPTIAYLMLNPSTADEKDNDPTIARCQKRAIENGYGKMIIVNLFPIRETYSTKLKNRENIIGDRSTADEYIRHAVGEAEITICAWGNHKLAIPRAKDVLHMLSEHNLSSRLFCLALNQNGTPSHPGRLANNLCMFAYEMKNQ